MDVAQVSMRLAVVVVLAAFPGLFVYSATDSAEARQEVTAMDGGPFVVPSSVGVYPARWDGIEIMVFVTTPSQLEGVDAARGEGEATPSVALPGQSNLRVFAISARSTHLGCHVGFNAELGASKDIADYNGDGQPDGRMLDVCHQGQWDPYNRGTWVAGPGERRLAVLDVFFHDGGLWAHEFDGPIGPPK